MGKEDIMRKISMILVCLGLCLGLSGCGNDSSKDTSKKKNGGIRICYRGSIR